MNSLPAETQFRLLKKSIPEAVVMAKVWGFNNQSLQDEIGLVFADRDIRQFEVNFSDTILFSVWKLKRIRS